VTGGLEMNMQQVRTLQGGCHCGVVRYSVDADLKQVISCNCSICSKKGLLLTFVSNAAFRVQSGEDHLQDYQFNKHVIHHFSCRTCGVESFARGVGPGGAEMVAVNVRCLDAVDIGALEPTPFNGKDL
jgi:hypothetical protein